jgi:hypothetical protein
MKIQPQSGLGDLIFSLPIIYDILSRGEEVRVATNHEYVCNPLSGYWGLSFESVEFGPGGFPIIKDGFTHLRYDRYGAHYFDRYYSPYGKLPLRESIRRVRETYFDGRKSTIDTEYAVYAPPRSARRHVNRKESEVFSCTPDPAYAKRIIDSYNMPMAMVGQDEVYAPITCMPKQFYDYRDKLSFDELCDLISYSSLVISQSSAITALAGLFGVPTHFLKAASETEEQHEKHINGVVWPGQEILK